MARLTEGPLREPQAISPSNCCQTEVISSSQIKHIKSTRVEQQQDCQSCRPRRQQATSKQHVNSQLAAPIVTARHRRSMPRLSPLMRLAVAFHLLCRCQSQSAPIFGGVCKVPPGPGRKSGKSSACSLQPACRVNHDARQWQPSILSSAHPDLLSSFLVIKPQVWI